MARAAEELGADPGLVVGTTADRRSLAVWRRDELIFAVPCADPVELAALAGRHMEGAAPA